MAAATFTPGGHAHAGTAGLGGQTLALYASMPAIMARDGIWVPDGGVHEIPLALHRLATRALDPALPPSRRLELLTRAARFATVGTVDAEPQALPAQP